VVRREAGDSGVDLAKGGLKVESLRLGIGLREDVVVVRGSGPDGCCKRWPAWVEAFQGEALMAGRRVKESRDRKSGP